MRAGRWIGTGITEPGPSRVQARMCRARQYPKRRVTARWRAFYLRATESTEPTENSKSRQRRHGKHGKHGMELLVRRNGLCLLRPDPKRQRKQPEKSHGIHGTHGREQGRGDGMLQRGTPTPSRQGFRSVDERCNKHSALHQWGQRIRCRGASELMLTTIAIIRNEGIPLSVLSVAPLTAF